MGSAPGDAVSAPPFPGIPLHEPVSALDSSSRLRPGSQGFSARAAAPLPRGVPSPSSPQPWRVPGGHPLTVPCGRTALGPVRASSVRRPPRTSQGPLVCTFSPADPRPAPDPAKGPGRFEGESNSLGSTAPCKTGLPARSPVRGLPSALQQNTRLGLVCLRAGEGYGGTTEAGWSYVLTDPSLGSWSGARAMGQRRGDRSGPASGVGRE